MKTLVESIQARLAEATNFSITPKQVVEDIFATMKKTSSGAKADYFTDEKDSVEVEVKNWGKWETEKGRGPHSEEYTVISDESKNAMDKIIGDAKKKFKNYKILWQLSSEKLIYVTAKKMQDH